MPFATIDGHVVPVCQEPKIKEDDPESNPQIKTKHVVYFARIKEIAPYFLLSLGIRPEFLHELLITIGILEFCSLEQLKETILRKLNKLIPKTSPVPDPTDQKLANLNRAFLSGLTIGLLKNGKQPLIDFGSLENNSPTQNTLTIDDLKRYFRFYRKTSESITEEIENRLITK